MKCWHVIEAESEVYDQSFPDFSPGCPWICLEVAEVFSYYSIILYISESVFILETCYLDVSVGANCKSTVNSNSLLDLCLLFFCYFYFIHLNDFAIALKWIQ